MMLVPRRNYGPDLSGEFFNDPFFTGSTKKNSDSRKLSMMRTDITERDGNHITEIKFPEFKKEGIKAELKDGYPTISAEHDASSESKGNEGTAVHRERHTSSYGRAFSVGEHTRQEDIKAGFENGILKLQIPKDASKVEETPEHIDIL